MDKRNINNLGDLTNLTREITTLGKQRGIGLSASPEWDYAIFYTLAALHEPDVVIESGTNIGISAVTWAFATGKEVYTWDPKNFEIKAEIFTNLESKVFRTIDKFTNASEKFLESKKAQKKLVFIDGNHSHEGSLGDYNKILPYLKEGDLLIFHDIRQPGVKETLSSLDIKVKKLNTTSGIGVHNVWNSST